MSRYYRPVDRYVSHGQHLGFRELCEAAIPASARFIVFDLDRTLHLARNMGEYMGWEMSAYHTYGGGRLELAEGTRDTSRFLMDWAHPLVSSRYVLRGARAWAYPGLFYLLWGRMAGTVEQGQRLRHRLFGTEPFTAIQAVPTLALMHDLSEVTVAVAAGLAGRLLERFAGDQVFDREDIAWLRARCPDARIVLSSASPRPTVEAAARRLGIDDWECSEIEVHDGRYSSPFQLGAGFLHEQEPRRISPPSRYRPNAGRAKVERLLRRYPRMRDAGCEVVGISDTWHGEDHCWAEHFSRVIDVNSTSPFPALVLQDAPLAEVHSAQLLTRHERERRAEGASDYLDPRRAKYLSAPVAGRFEGPEIAARLAGVSREVETVAARRDRLGAESAGRRASLAREIDAATLALEHAVEAYNDAGSGNRRRQLREVNRLAREYGRTLRRRARAERAISDLSRALSRQLTAGRRLLEGDRLGRGSEHSFVPALKA